MSPETFGLQVPAETLKPLVREILIEALTYQEACRAKLGERLAYSEAEGAALLGLNDHQLRDERHRGRIMASVGPGRKILYLRSDLLDYLMRRRWEPKGEGE
jgi:hypothetical protein